MVTEAIPNQLLTGKHFYQDFAHKVFNLKDGQYDKAKEFFCRYAGFGQVKTATILGTQALYMKPALPDANTFGNTRACSVVITKLVKNFHLKLKMATIEQTKGKDAKNWETAWIMLRASDQSHHYYMYIQKDGGIELGKKDMKVWKEKQIFLKTVDPDPKLTLKKWNNIEIKMVGFRIQIWVDGKLYIDMVDDGKTGNFGKVAPHPPSPNMAQGFIGFYCEDAAVAFDRIDIMDLQ